MSRPDTSPTPRRWPDRRRPTEPCRARFASAALAGTWANRYGGTDPYRLAPLAGAAGRRPGLLRPQGRGGDAHGGRPAAPGQPSAAGGRHHLRAPLLVHVTTSDISLALLLGPQLSAFAAAGYDVVGVSAAAPTCPTSSVAGIRHMALRHATRSVSVLDDVRAAAELYQLLRRLRPDIVHTHTPKPGIYGRRWGAGAAGVPVVVNTVHGLYATVEDSLRPAGAPSTGWSAWPPRARTPSWSRTRRTWPLLRQAARVPAGTGSTCSATASTWRRFAPGPKAQAARRRGPGRTGRGRRDRRRWCGRALGLGEGLRRQPSWRLGSCAGAAPR